MQYRLISNDTHLEVSPDRWRDYIAPGYRDRGPRIVPWHQGGEAWAMDGVAQRIPLALNLCAGKAPNQWKFYGWRYDEGHVGTGDAAQRVREMDEDGVLAEIEYQAVAGPGWYAQAAETDPELYLAVVEAYNDFISDFCMYAPDRLLGLAMVPVTGVADAVAELKRTRGKPGIKGWQLLRYPSGKGYPTPEDDRFWAEAVRLKAPISAHASFGGGPEADPDAGRIKGNASTLQNLLAGGAPTCFYTTMQMAVKGVFDRFPDLKLHFAETGVGWVPYHLEQADDRMMRHKFAELRENPDFVEPKLLPSDYFHRHVLLGFQVDYHGIAHRHAIGLRNMAWGNDFPHAVGDWPYSQRVVREQFAGVPREEAEPILWRNIAEFYHLAAYLTEGATAPEPAGVMTGAPA
jgi:predicted TIM-barrel fold metal-dependent hydrolase